MNISDKSEKEQLEYLTKLLKQINQDSKKIEKLSEKARNTNFQNSTPKQTQKASVNLNWACLSLDKSKTDFARAFKGSCLDVNTEEKEYNPSGFHHYRH